MLSSTMHCFLLTRPSSLLSGDSVCQSAQHSTVLYDDSGQARGVRYGRTGAGAHVDMAALERLATLGYARPLAAEDLRQVTALLLLQMHVSATVYRFFDRMSV